MKPSLQVSVAILRRPRGAAVGLMLEHSEHPGAPIMIPLWGSTPHELAAALREAAADLAAGKQGPAHPIPSDHEPGEYK